ncbi:MAG TPA: DHHA1 domain-containing protein [Vicinamibacterales bacterium]|nr:DHHA1 domain-containing protein [Vicinamibacterales bacterium]
MTERIYYTDAARRSFDAVVTAAVVHEGTLAVVLDRTAFYPTSGGQPFDIGRLGTTDVVNTIDDGENVLHVVKSPLGVGETVRGEIDWVRRFDHMQQHTGQHVLSAAFDRVLDNRTMSFHMGGESATIDLAREVSPADVERCVDEANRVVWEDRAVTIRFASPEEAARLPLRKEPVREGPLRLIDIADFDLSACGGTHVSRTGEIGLIAVTATEKFRGGMRLTFVCGGRALRALREYRDAVAGSVRALSVLPHELPATVERIQIEGKQARKTISRLQSDLAVHEAARLIAASPAVDGNRRTAHVVDGWDSAGIKAIASAMTAQAGIAVALLGTSAPMGLVVARSSDVALDANAVLQQLLKRFGGRGGGKAELAQGAGLAGDPQEIAAAARDLIRT